MSDSPSEQDSSSAQPSFGTDLTTGSVAKKLLFFSVPMLMGSLAHTAYMIINAIWVGKGLGSNAMAAVTTCFPIIFVLMAVAGGLTLATNVLVSQSYGAKNLDYLKRVVQNSTVIIVILSVLCLVLGYWTAPFLVRSMKTPPDVQPMAISYMRLVVLMTPFMFAVFLMASVLRGVGDSKTPLYFQASSLVATAVLDPLLMFGWAGFPRLGLNGTAVATIIAQAGAAIALAYYLRRTSHLVAPNWRSLRLDADVSLLTLKIGLPSMFQQAMVSIGFMFIVSMVNRFGTHCAAAFGAGMRIDQLAFMPAMAIGQAASTLVGQNIGANRYDRVKLILRWGLILGWALTLPASLAALGAPSLLMRMFAEEADVIAIGAHYLRIASVGYLLVTVMFVTNGVINGSGHTIATTMFTLVVFWVVRIPLAALFSRHFDRVDGIWYAILLSFIFGSTMSVSYYLSGRWRRPVAKNTALRASTIGAE